MDNFNLTGMKGRRIILIPLLVLYMVKMLSCNSTESYYSADDFGKVSKIDAHFHYLSFDDSYMKFAIDQNFRLLTPIWEGEEVPIDVQFRLSDSVQNRFPEYYTFFASFPSDSINSKRFAEITIENIKNSMKAGATGIKIWKNIGMVLKYPDGRFIMIDDPVFEPVFKFLEENKIPVIAHLGEPKDCWLPFEEMTDPGDVSYYRDNPQFHMYYHTDVPSYERQIEARDNLLGKHPKLDFTGAHLGSLEWSVYELSRRFDKFPNMKVDLAARMFHLQYQSERDYDHVRNFMVKYQDRIVYGTDFEVHDLPGVDAAVTFENLNTGWRAHWMYLATDSVINNIRGLKLPTDVIDKIYYLNARRFFTKRNH
jgi:predicted TIM-barrel fold metal-dependent hydrolase